MSQMQRHNDMPRHWGAHSACYQDRIVWSPYGHIDCFLDLLRSKSSHNHTRCDVWGWGSTSTGRRGPPCHWLCCGLSCGSLLNSVLVFASNVPSALFTPETHLMCCSPKSLIPFAALMPDPCTTSTRSAALSNPPTRQYMFDRFWTLALIHLRGFALVRSFRGQDLSTSHHITVPPSLHLCQQQRLPLLKACNT